MQLELRTNVMNWQDPLAKVTLNFTVSDCLTLHTWGRLATSCDGADFAKLTILCNKMEQVREILGCPMIVTSVFRSPEYNKSQGINPNKDIHSFSEAMDFHCGDQYTTDEIKELLMPELEKLGIRMENNGNKSSWIHLDIHPIGQSGRFFNP